VTTLRDLPPDGWYILAAFNAVTAAAVPQHDPLTAIARRWLTGRRQDGDEAALRAWLREHPEYEITRLPAPAAVAAPVPDARPGQRQLGGETAA